MKAEKRSELAEILVACRSAFLSIAALSGMINVLALTGSIYMLAVYDRVLASGSIPTLVGLSIIAVCLYFFHGTLEVIRSRLLSRVSSTLYDIASPRVFDIIVRRRAGTPATEGSQPLRDLDSVRTFLASPGPTALFDLPWMPLYLGICFLFHWAIGTAVLIGALVLIGLTVTSEVVTRGRNKETNVLMAKRYSFVEMVLRSAPAVRSMGMGRNILNVYAGTDSEITRQSTTLADLATTLSTLSRSFRMMLQSAVLGLGAYLVIKGEASPGVMIASSILSARALAPVEVAIGNWRNFLSARSGWGRLNELMQSMPREQNVLQLPPPREKLEVSRITLLAPGAEQRVLLRDVDFSVNAGTGVGVIGPSASGKSTLARALVGLWTPQRGAVRLDGAALSHWSVERLGQHIGYLPQDVELIEGTIAQNISRFDPKATAEGVVEAAKAAGVHDLIVTLPHGYQTTVGDGGISLSAGQAQRVALARALYGNPFLVVLDEPNSNLDAEGERALTEAIEHVRERGGVVIVIAHRPSVLAAIDQVLVLQSGAAVAFGPRDEILKKVMRRRGPEQAEAGPVRAVEAPAATATLK